MARPSLTTCIPTYNHVELLPKAIQSVLAQRRRPDRIIILDDASTDGTAAYLQDLASRHPDLQIERNPVNLGVIASINRLAGLAQTRYVHFLASDDLLLQDFYQLSLDQLARFPEAALSCMPFTCFHQGEEDLAWEHGPEWSREPRWFRPAELAAMSTLGAIHGNTVVIDRDAFLAAGGLISQLEWRSDWFCNWVAGFRQGMVFIPAHSAIASMSPQQYSAGRNHLSQDGQVIQELIRLLHTPAYADVRAAFLQGDALFSFELPLLVLAFEALGWPADSLPCLKRRAQLAVATQEGATPPRTPLDERYAYGYLRPRLETLVQTWNQAGRRVVVFGGGEHTGSLFKWTPLAQAPLIGIVDNNERIHGKVFWGLEVSPVARLAELKPDVVLVSTALFQRGIIEQVRALAPEAAIEHLYPLEQP